VAVAGQEVHPHEPLVAVAVLVVAMVAQVTVAAQVLVLEGL
tara:strand:+ start:126 stop:248 length:123 start_codon:yes stop_codon:yes gene_type:complete